MDSGTATVVGVVIGAVLGAVFQIVAGVIDAARTKRRGDIEHRRAAYLTLVEASDAHMPKVQDAQFARLTKDSEPKAYLATLEALAVTYRAMSHALTKVEFYAPAGVAAKAAELRETITRFSSLSMADNEFDRLYSAYRAAHYEFMVAARADLDLPPSSWHAERLALHEERQRESAAR